MLGGFNYGYLGSLIMVNTPQLLLSLCYFSYNALVTRIHIEQEWNSYSLSYKPLRVSYPAGEQTSTYRLELPYKITNTACFYWVPIYSCTGFCLVRFISS